MLNFLSQVAADDHQVVVYYLIFMRPASLARDLIGGVMHVVAVVLPGKGKHRRR